MWERIFHSNSVPFAIAVTVVLLLLLVQVVQLLTGSLGLGDHDAEHDANGDIDGDGDHDFVDVVGDWLHFGSLPVTVILTLFVTGFGLVGLGIQFFTYNTFNPWLTALIAIPAGVLFARYPGQFLRKMLFNEHTRAVPSDSFVGNTAVITLGETRKGTPTQAKLVDDFGQSHYVLVEPFDELDTFGNGDSVILVERQGSKFLVVGNSTDALLKLSAGSSRVNSGTPIPE